MRNSIVMLPLLILLSTSQWAESSELVKDPNTQDFIADKYSGKYDDLEKNGYTQENGISLNVKRIPQALAFAVCQPFNKERPVDCVLVVTEILGRDELGHAKRATPAEMIHIKLPKEWGYFDTDDTGCKAIGYPKANIVAIGIWKWREKPLHGGFVHSLKKAWRIDYQALRFVEIPTRDVECGFDEDRD